MKTLEQLEYQMSSPTDALIKKMGEMEGDILILGVGGKVGPSVAVMAQRAVEAAGVDKKIFGAARFTDPALRKHLDDSGVVTLSADLTNDADLDALPSAANIIFMAGNKFGTAGNEHFTWMMNSYLPGRVAQRFRTSRIVAFSTLLVYPMADVTQAGSRESDPVGPHGEYAASCVGRERVFEHFALKNMTPLVIFRLGYSIETRYGVLQEIAQTVYDRKPVNLEMSHASVIWQGDVADYALRSLPLASTPPRRLNITGPGIVSVRWLAERFGERFNVEPVFQGTEATTAYVMDGSDAHHTLGYPRIDLLQMIEWVGDWVEGSGPTIGKPTRFQERTGVF